MNKVNFSTWVMFFICLSSYSQVSIGSDTVDDSSMLEIHSNNRGLLVPNVELINTTTNLGVTPSESLFLYNTTIQNDVEKGFYYWSDANQWERILDDITNYNSTSTTPWYKSGTTDESKNLLDDIYTSGELYVRPNSSFVGLGLDRIFYLESESGDPDIYSFGHFSNTNQAFSIDICHGAGTSYSTAMSIDDDGGHGISGNWDAGSLRFVGTYDAFLYTGRTPYAEIKVTSWTNSNITGTRTPSQMLFETCDDGSDNPSRVFRLHYHGHIDFNNGRSVNNWDTNTLSTDRVVGLSGDQLVKVDKSNFARTSSINSLDYTPFVLKIGELVLSDNTLKQSTTMVVDSQDVLPPLQLVDCPLFNSNDDAINEGLSKGMVYKTSQGELKVVY